MRGLGLASILAILAVATALFGATGSAEAAPTCTASAVNAVGAHAGSLSSRIAATVDCDQQVTLEFTLPGNSEFTFDSDADGHFMGVVGDAYLCQSNDPVIGVLARAADNSTWLSSVTITTEQGAPAATGFGPECDILLQPALNFFTWNGPYVAIDVGISQQTLGSPLPRSDNSSTDPLDHISSVSMYDPQAGHFLTWVPGSPTFVSSLHVLLPGNTYVLSSDADIPLLYPASGQ